jgi:hypothetical protein
MRKILFLAALVLASVMLLCCGGTSPGANSANGDTPTAAYTRLFNAVKSKDVNAIKDQMTKRTIERARSSAKQWQKSEDAVLEHGMVASTFADTLPEMRDERIKDNMGAVEVWNAHDGLWEDLPFMVEDGRFKLALGELMAGSFNWPGKGRSARELELNTNIPNINTHPVRNGANAANGK